VTQALDPWTLPPMDQEVLRKLLYQRASNYVPAPEPRPVDTETPKALAIQRTWLELPAVKQRRKLAGWDAPIHRHTRVTYRDVRDTPRYNWHRFMLRQIREEGQ
jgi:hypothetical protein